MIAEKPRRLKISTLLSIAIPSKKIEAIKVALTTDGGKPTVKA
ncbi:hypothetical protein JGI16_11432 [Candidatus Kryptonium thompsonii]|nr:hypothetical protein JGI16_11432 [Candidatus Kryptonium thompsoni]